MMMNRRIINHIS